MVDPSAYVHPHGLCESDEIGPRSRIWAFAHVMKGARVGADCNIGDHAFLESGARVGDRVTVKNAVLVWDRVTLEDDVFVGPNAVFTNDRRPRSGALKRPPDQFLDTRVCRGASVGANATIVCGVTLGAHCFVGAGAVVVSDVAPHALVVGNPARRVGWVCACGETLPEALACPCGRGYGTPRTERASSSAEAMYRGLKVAAVAPVLDEEKHIRTVVRRTPRTVVDETVVVDDGSRDGSAAAAREEGATVLGLGQTRGVGAALRHAYAYALGRGHDVIVTMAGNNKDAPEEIPLLLDPLAEGRADFVQGSRFLKADADFGDMPVYRRFATRLHPLAFSLVAGRKVSESTNGFRAFRATILRDPRLRLDQAWLDEYELEPYLYLKAIRLGYRTAEVPVTKTYPPRELGQTKMRPLVDWWSILRPLVFVGLGLRK